jgi:MFS family permease
MSKDPVLNPFARALGTPDSLMGFVAAASTIPGILVSLPAGSLSDIFGRRKLLIVSGIVFASAPFLYLFVFSWWQLVLVRFYHGFATAMFVPITNAYLAETFPTKKAERISLFSSATTVGRSLAPFLGGYILFVTNYGFQQLYLAVGVAGVTALITALLLLKENSQPSQRDRSFAGSRLFQGWAIVARNTSVLVVSLVESAQYYVYGAVEFFLIGYLMEVAHFDSLSFGIISGAQLATVPLLKPLTGKLSDRIGRRIPIVAGSLISASSLIVIPFTTNFGFLLMVSILYGFGFSMVTASTPALTSELVEHELVGAGMGFLSTIMDVGQTLGPIVTGLILATSLAYVGSFASLTAVLLATCTIFVGAGIGKKGYEVNR